MTVESNNMWLTPKFSLTLFRELRDHLVAVLMAGANFQATLLIGREAY